MEKYIQAIFDLKKLPSQVCAVLAASGAFLFYAPRKWVLIKLNPESDIYVYIYIAFVISVFIVILSFFHLIIKALKTFWTYIVKVNNINREIAMLNEEEKSVLREFYAKDRSIIDMPTSDEIVRDLITKKIIVSASNVYLRGGFHPYRISESFRNRIYPVKHLNYPMLGAGPEEMKVFEDSRPDWI